MNLITEDNQRLIDDAIRSWKREYKNYRFWVNLYIVLMFIPFFIGSIALFFVNQVIAYICTVFSIGYVIFVIMPAFGEWSKIKRTNLHNIHNIKIGVIRRKYYKQRKFSIYLLGKKNNGEVDRVRATELQFNKFKIGDKIVYFEFYPNEYAVTYLPETLKDIEEALNQSDAYTPTLKDIDDFSRFRREITLYDNYLVYSIVIIVLMTRNYNRS